MRGAGLSLTIVLALVGLSTGLAWAQDEAGPLPAISVTMRTHEDAVYLKRPFLLTMTLVNGGTTPVTLDASCFAAESFRLVDEKGRGPGKAMGGARVPEPLRIDGQETLEREVDLST